MDSVRALAALSILVHHALPRGGVHAPGTLLGPYAARLDAGVAIFFVVSGCLLYRPFAVALASGDDRPENAAYAWRRALRIFPAYWVALAGVLLATGEWRTLSLADDLPQFVLAQIYGDHGAVLPQAWSLCVEISFYAFVPAFAALLSRSSGDWFRTQLAGLGALVAVSLVWKLGRLHWDAPFGERWLPTYLDQFALGMALAVISVRMDRGEALPAWLRALPRRPAAGWALASGAFLASTRIGLPGHYTAGWYEPAGDAQVLARHGLYSLVGLGVTLPAVLAASGWVVRVLSWRPLLWLGTVSYGLYLWQFLVLDSVMPAAPTFAHPYAWYVLGGLALTAVVAWLSYRFVEQRALRLKRLAAGYAEASEPRGSITATSMRSAIRSAV